MKKLLEHISIIKDKKFQKEILLGLKNRLKIKKQIEFKNDRDISLYFGDYNLYLKSVIVEKRKQGLFNLNVMEFLKFLKKIYQNDNETIKKALEYLTSDELKTYKELYNKYNTSIQSKWITKLTEREKFTLRNYAENFASIPRDEALEYYGYESNYSYVTLNELLRSGKSKGDEDIDSALSKFGKLENPIIVYRGVNKEGFEDYFKEINENNIKSLIGKIYSDKSYMSTSLLKDSANATGNKGTDIIFKITVPNDANYGAYIEYLSNMDYRQREFLIKKDSNSIITDAYYDDKNKIIIEMTLMKEKTLTKVL